MASAEMKKLFWRFRYSGAGFLYRGIWYCRTKYKPTRVINRRILAFNKFGNWTGAGADTDT